MKSFVIARNFSLLPLLLLVSACSGGKGRPGLSFPRGKVKVKAKELEVEVAWTEELRFHGYRFRRSVPEGEGMIFLFPKERYLTFVMTDTPVPLSIAFAKRDGTIVQIEDMEPFSNRHYNSVRKAAVALEVPRGWFKKNSIKVGDRIEGLELLFKKFPPR